MSDSRINLVLEVSADPPDVRVNVHGTMSPSVARTLAEVSQIVSHPGISPETAAQILDWTARLLRAAAEAEWIEPGTEKS